MTQEIHARFSLVKFFLHPIDFFDLRWRISLFSGVSPRFGRSSRGGQSGVASEVGAGASAEGRDNVFTKPAVLGWNCNDATIRTGTIAEDTPDGAPPSRTQQHFTPPVSPPHSLHLSPLPARTIALGLGSLGADRYHADLECGGGCRRSFFAGVSEPFTAGGHAAAGRTGSGWLQNGKIRGGVAKNFCAAGGKAARRQARWRRLGRANANGHRGLFAAIAEGY